jgi:hypothetical protein
VTTHLEARVRAPQWRVDLGIAIVRVARVVHLVAPSIGLALALVGCRVATTAVEVRPCR